MVDAQEYISSSIYQAKSKVDEKLFHHNKEIFSSFLTEDMTTSTYHIALLVISIMIGTDLLMKSSDAKVIYDGYNRSFVAIPSDIPLDVTYLNLRLNNIDHIPDDAFVPYRDLDELIMHHNPLTSISTNAFRGSTITRILMSGIDATEYPNIKIICGQLQVFNFIPNSKIVIPDNYTECMTKVSTLEVNGITESSLHDLRKVSSTVARLSLVEGDLSEIPVNAFEDFPKLYSLKVSQTGLFSFPNLTYVARKLRKLQLLWDDITEVPYDMLAMLPSLEYLNLAGQKLISIPDPVMGIETLLLRSNRLTDSTRMSDWLRCKNLTIFNIIGNQLTYIPDLVSMGFREIRVYASNNPFNCTCALMGWMFKKRSVMKGRDIDMKLSECPCAAPAHLTSVSWNSMTIEQICPYCKYSSIHFC